MRALVLREHGPLDNLAIEESPDPRPEPDEVLIDVHAASVNFPDLMVINGTYQRLPPRPFVPGKDVAGVVAAAGANVTGFKAGDRVMAQIEWGAFAERCAAPARSCYVMPRPMSFAEGAAMGLAYLTSHFALVERAGLQPGETVLVNGAGGGVGLAAAQIAKALGARVLAAVSSEEKARLARANGADHVIYTNVADLRERFRDQVFAATGRRGADIIIDPVGGDVFDASLRAVAWCGRIVIVGFASGRIPEVKAGLILVKNISLIGLQISDYRDREPAKARRAQERLFELYSAGKVRPHVMASYPLADYAQALSAVAERRVLGKVVLTMR